MTPSPDQPAVIAYVASQLPKRSETFVYREVLGLRARGRDVVAVSVRPPESDLGDPALDLLAADAVVVYDGRMVFDGLIQAIRSPLALLRGLTDAMLGLGLSLNQRGKVVVQTLGGLALARRLRSQGVTHLHAHMAHVPTTIAMVAAHALGVPFSFTGHAADLFRDRQLLEPKLTRAAFAACISHWHRRWYRQIDGRLCDYRLPIVRCGVDVDDFRPTPEPDGPLGILAVGRLVPKKGFDVLLEAWAGVVGEWASSTTAEPPTLTLVGDGPEADALSEQARRLGIEDTVHMVGAESNAKVHARMAGCAAFVLPCRPAGDGDRDGIPVVLMEAMACGKPVISGDLHAIRELVSDNETGCLVPPGYADSLKDALTGLLTDADRRHRLGEAGRQRVVDEFSQGVNLDRLEAAFAEAGANHHG